MRIYMDNCCINRPFDDQSNLRVHLEGEVIKTFQDINVKISTPLVWLNEVLS